MARDFHDKPFSDETKLKLELFRRYTREWISVFLTQKKYKRINIFDYFAGPGRDVSGYSGSPLVVVDELKKYCEVKADLKNFGVDVCLFFYDSDRKKIDELAKNIDRIECRKGCCQIKVETKPFEEAFTDSIPILENQKSANLVILDPFGVSDVTPDIVSRLAGIETTDILLFIPSSYLRRFKDDPQFVARQGLDPAELENIEHGQIHRYVFDHYKSEIPDDLEYFMAPFSIKKGSNIHGIMFGSRCLLGLDKFLKVCWSLDKKTGEANYNIDDDIIWSGQHSLFPELNVTTKARYFINSLIDELRKHSVDNRMMYKFVLESGFATSKARDILIQLQTEGIIDVRLIDARKGAFYLNWKNYLKRERRVEFRLLEP